MIAPQGKICSAKRFLDARMYLLLQNYVFATVKDKPCKRIGPDIENVALCNCRGISGRTRETYALARSPLVEAVQKKGPRLN